jgi:hypothetical protein
VLDSSDLPGESLVGFEPAPECRFALAVEWWWLFDPPVEEATCLASAWPFDFSSVWPFDFDFAWPFDFADDDFSGFAGDSDFGEAVDGAGDPVVGACSSAGSGGGAGGCACSAGGTWTA